MSASAHETARTVEDQGRVVVVSSSSPLRHRLDKELPRYGFEVIVTDDTTLAIAMLIVPERIDVVLLDAPLAHAHSSALQQLKEASPKTPVLFLYDHVPNAEDRLSVLRHGADGVVIRGDDSAVIASTLMLHVKR